MQVGKNDDIIKPALRKEAGMDTALTKESTIKRIQSMPDNGITYDVLKIIDGILDISQPGTIKRGKRKIGVAKGRLQMDDKAFDDLDEEVAASFFRR